MTVEERIAALEAQVAEFSARAMAAAEPSGYYTSKYSGEEIDAAIDKVLKG